jgi:putative ubiquitin-RnfH superfamily antitoxin RatB of RatAB toxin-antitoxin module
MTTAVEENTDYASYKGKRVVVTYNAPNGELVEVEGLVETGNAIGILIKPKGKAQVDLIEVDRIENVTEIEDGPKKLRRKPLGLIAEAKARAHLLERHAYTLAQVNGMTDESAFKLHESIDHDASDLGHYHKASEDAAKDAVPSESEGEQLELPGTAESTGPGAPVDSSVAY